MLLLGVEFDEVAWMFGGRLYGRTPPFVPTGSVALLTGNRVLGRAMGGLDVELEAQAWPEKGKRRCYYYKNCS